MKYQIGVATQFSRDHRARPCCCLPSHRLQLADAIESGLANGTVMYQLSPNFFFLALLLPLAHFVPHEF